jgi:hypothetical protein
MHEHLDLMNAFKSRQGKNFSPHIILHMNEKHRGRSRSRASSQSSFIPVVEGKINPSMLTIARSFEDLVGMHNRQMISGKTINRIPDIFHGASIGKIDSDSHIGKAAQWSRAHATDNCTLSAFCA